LLVALGVSTAIAPAAAAQSGTVAFGGGFDGDVPTTLFMGPILTFSSQVRSGFGNSAMVATADGRWWTNSYSGRGMLYGNNSGVGNVLEVTLDAGAGFSLSLTEAIFGGWLNRAANVTFQLFNADFTQTTGPFTVLTGTMTPASALFAANGWGSLVRLQFTETNTAGAPAGRGAFDVGVQDIQYAVRAVGNPNVVPEPATYILLVTGMGMLGVVARRRRSVLAERV